MKRVLFIMYPKYADFQIAHTLFLLTKIGNVSILTSSIDGKPVESIGGLKTQASISLHEVDIADVDLILLPGGDGVFNVLHESIISDILKKSERLGVPLASICGAAALLAKAGVLSGRKFTCFLSTIENNEALFSSATYTGANIEVDGKIITAKGTAFAELAVSVCEQLNIFNNEEQKDSFFKFCKGID